MTTSPRDDNRSAPSASMAVYWQGCGAWATQRRTALCGAHA